MKKYCKFLKNSEKFCRFLICSESYNKFSESLMYISEIYIKNQKNSEIHRKISEIYIKLSEIYSSDCRGDRGVGVQPNRERLRDIA